MNGNVICYVAIALPLIGLSILSYIEFGLECWFTVCFICSTATYLMAGLLWWCDKHMEKGGKQ